MTGNQPSMTGNQPSMRGNRPPTLADQLPVGEGPHPTVTPPETTGSTWEDGLIARRAPERAASTEPGAAAATQSGLRPASYSSTSGASNSSGGHTESAATVDDASPATAHDAAESPDPAVADLVRRLGALRELVGLSRARLPEDALAEAGRVLNEAETRGRLPREYTTVALAGATGSGKSALFNALAGAEIAASGVRRPTTATPHSCTWPADGEPDTGAAEGLLDRLGVTPVARHRAHTSGLGGLVLVDLPDHDSVAPGHREIVDRTLRLVDAVIWVTDPEKYADAVLHERYLRALAGYADVTFVVLNQADRLPGEAAAAVLDDLRRLLDEDGIALGEHGEPGARVHLASALTGDGVPELRLDLADFVAQRRAAALRLRADLDGVAERLRPVYTEPAPGAHGPTGLTDIAREEYEDLLATAVGATAAGQAAERAWLRQAEWYCGSPWTSLTRRPTDRRSTDRHPRPVDGPPDEPAPGGQPTSDGGATIRNPVARPVVAQAVRTLADHAAAGLPEPWNRSVREAAWRGAAGLPEALDEVVHQMTDPVDERTGHTAHRPTTTSRDAPQDQDVPNPRGPRANRNPRTAGNPRAERSPRMNRNPFKKMNRNPFKNRHATDDQEQLRKQHPNPPQERNRNPLRGRNQFAGGSPLTGPEVPSGQCQEVPPEVPRPTPDRPVVPRPSWGPAVRAGQWLLLGCQLLSALWLVGCLWGLAAGSAALPGGLLIASAVGSPALAWTCAVLARGPARAYGQEAERALRRRAAGCGRARVLEPVAAELLRYREVREQYVIAAGDVGWR
ncbi:GTPase [Streptomyces sp. AJS327]|uniref:GTPase n=1 Tax=Streptomyces sp. AJS327 TaxID=2545265 RepID=UPI002155232D|nr:GTPase [Streptomyces sp. AJS327]